MKNLILLTSLLFVFCLLGCENSEDIEIEKKDTKTIPIDANQAFNQDNFITSFEQLFASYELWAWSFSHEFNNAHLSKTFQKKHVLGEYGEEFEIIHNYDDNGVIVSSSRKSSTLNKKAMTFEYEYDLEGYILKLIKLTNGVTIDKVSFTYDENKKLINKTHQITEDDGLLPEKLIYNDDGRLSEYFDVDGIKIEFKYADDMMIEEKMYYSNYTKVSTYLYDDKKRIIKISIDDNYGPETYTFEYSVDKLIHSKLGHTGLVRYREEYIKGFVLVKETYTNWDIDTQEIIYSTEKIFNNSTGQAEKAVYYSINEKLGSIEFDSEEVLDEEIINSYSIKDHNGTLLYHCVATKTLNKWGNYSTESWEIKDKDGMIIDPYNSDMEDWVLELISLMY